MPQHEPSLVATIDSWRAAGYRTDLSVQPGGLYCGACEHVREACDVQIDHLERFEGVSDPDDQAIALALTCQGCGARGTLVAPYGPSATEADAEVLAQLRDARP